MGLTKTRELVKEMFVQALNHERLPWQMPWQNHLMYNPKTGTIYNGINQFVLSYIAGSRGYEDPRWLTFNQIAKSPDLHLMKGSKGAPVEYWAIYDKLAKKNISLIDKIKVCAADPSREKDMVLKGRTYYVFNGQCIEGMPPVPEIDNGTMAISNASILFKPTAKIRIQQSSIQEIVPFIDQQPMKSTFQTSNGSRIRAFIMEH